PSSILESRMTDVVRVDPQLPPDRLFEREHDRQAVEMATERYRAIRSPRPDLRRAIPEDAYTGFPEGPSEDCVELRVVDEKGRFRPPPMDGRAELAIGDGNAVGAPDDLRHAERRQRAQVRDELHPHGLERRAAHPEGGDPHPLGQRGLAP